MPDDPRARERASRRTLILAPAGGRRGPSGPPAAVAAGVVALDQVSKAIVLATLGPDRADQDVALIGSVVGIEYAENRGAAFGLLGGQNAALAVLAAAVLVGLALFYRRRSDPSGKLVATVGLIAGGAIGNLLDRVRLGYVVDFVAVGSWPNFNVADSAITVGVAWLVVLLLDEPSQHRKDGRSPGEAHGAPERR